MDREVLVEDFGAIYPWKTCREQRMMSVIRQHQPFKQLP